MYNFSSTSEKNRGIGKKHLVIISSLKVAYLRHMCAFPPVSLTIDIIQLTVYKVHLLVLPESLDTTLLESCMKGLCIKTNIPLPPTSHIYY